MGRKFLGLLTLVATFAAAQMSAEAASMPIGRFDSAADALMPIGRSTSTLDSAMPIGRQTVDMAIPIGRLTSMPIGR